MPDLPILTPSECAKLSEIEAKMEGVPWHYSDGLYVGNDGLCYGDLDMEDPDIEGVIALRNAAPRMLATIAALRIEVDMWEG